MTSHHRHRSFAPKMTPQQWQREFPQRHRKFRRAAAPLLGEPTEAERADYTRARTEWAAFLDALPVGDQQQQTEQQQVPQQ